MSEPGKKSQDFATQIKSNSRYKNHGLVVQINESSFTEGIDLPKKLPNSKERKEEEYPSTFAATMNNLLMMLNPKEEQSFADQIKCISSYESNQIFKRNETKEKSVLKKGEKVVYCCDTQYHPRIKKENSNPLVMVTPEKKQSFADQIKSNPRYANNQLLKEFKQRKRVCQREENRRQLALIHNMNLLSKQRTASLS
mmetsp:Transcript_34151/g.50187  ORF Transcript_34151/g.50187 Transcript_34151/m.50187 type:complete len:197 (+) Transcript_34151:101-691(+)